MSAQQEPEPDTGEPENSEAQEAPGESDAMSERTARVILALVGVGAVWGLVAAFPWIAYIIVGILGTLAVQTLQAWLAQRQKSGGPADEGAPEPTTTELSDDDVVQALHFLAAPNVFLSSLAAHLDVTMAAMRAVLEAMGIQVRRAVRVGGTTGVGVHADDIPPLPQPLSEDPVDGVDQEQPTNQQGVRIERTDGGFVIYDLTDGHHHAVDKEAEGR
ncbi:hypothetical protein [Streptomyces sp. NPDC046909]|uniref:hypothetical protein n=1 Tax=Streptomyces sp. NPDC046909 TaxID=3155617 RepID=UPI003401C008